MSSPHSVWTSFAEAAAGSLSGGRGSPVAAVSERLRSSAGAAAAGSGKAAVAEAAESTQEMAAAAQGVISEASRLAADIIEAGAGTPAFCWTIAQPLRTVEVTW